MTNSYKVYCRVMDDAGVSVSQRLSHYDYLLSIATAWIDREEEDVRQIRRCCLRKRKRQTQAETSPTTVSTPTSNRSTRSSTAASAISELTSPGSVASHRGSKAPRVNDSSLHPDSGALRCRLDHYGKYHAPDPPEVKIPSCALHRWAVGRETGSKSQTRLNIVCCSICKVNLCISCFNTFHTVKDIISKREEIAESL